MKNNPPNLQQQKSSISLLTTVWAGLCGKSPSLPQGTSSETARVGLEDPLPRRYTHKAGEAVTSVPLRLGLALGSMGFLTLWWLGSSNQCPKKRPQWPVS